MVVGAIAENFVKKNFNLKRYCTVGRMYVYVRLCTIPARTRTGGLDYLDQPSVTSPPRDAVVSPFLFLVVASSRKPR